MGQDISIALISFGGAIIAGLFSLFVGLRTSKQQNVVNAITSKRIDLVNQMRKAMLNYLKEYLKKEKANQYNLTVASATIELYIQNYSGVYNGLKMQLKLCSSQPFSTENYEMLMIEMQSVLNYRWRRTKKEAGIANELDASAKSTEIILERKRQQQQRYRTGWKG